MWSDEEIANAKQDVLDRTDTKYRELVQAKIDGFLATIAYNRSLKNMLEASQACVDEVQA